MFCKIVSRRFRFERIGMGVRYIPLDFFGSAIKKGFVVDNASVVY